MTDLTERLRERMAVATALPWTINPPGMWWDQGQTYGVPVIGMHDARYYNSAPSRDDAEFMVDAVNALPDLLTTLETLTQENARLREALEGIKADVWCDTRSRALARKALGGGDE